MRTGWNILRSLNSKRSLPERLVMLACGAIVGFSTANCLPGDAREDKGPNPAAGESVQIHHSASERSQEQTEEGKYLRIYSDRTGINPFPLGGESLFGRFSPWLSSMFPEFVLAETEPFVNTRTLSSNSRSFMPTLDMDESESKIKLTLEVPGIDAKHLELTVDDDTVTVKGKREEQESLSEKGCSSNLRSYGTFVRKIKMPCKIDAEKAIATLKNGILTINADKLQLSQHDGKKISIKSE